MKRVKRAAWDLATMALVFIAPLASSMSPDSVPLRLVSALVQGIAPVTLCAVLMWCNPFSEARS